MDLLNFNYGSRTQSNKPRRLMGDITNKRASIPITAAERSRISTALNIPYNGWHVNDVTEGKNHLYLLHYTEKIPPPSLYNIRGTVIAFNGDKIVTVATSFGYTPKAVINSFDSVALDKNEVKSVSVVDDNGKVQKFTFNGSTIAKRAFEGTILRIIWWGGKMHMMTHKRLTVKNSRHGDSYTFEELFFKCGGPNKEFLFDTTKQYDPWCYIFLISHPSLWSSSLQLTSCGYLVLVDIVKMDISSYPNDEWTDSPSPISKFTITEGFTPNEIYDIKQGQVIVSNLMSSSVKTPFIHIPGNLGKTAIDAFLNHGFHAPSNPIDPRYGSGEQIIIISRSSKGKIIQTLRLFSTASWYRTKLHSNGAYQMKEFFKLAGDAARSRKPDDLKILYDSYVWTPLIDPDVFMKNLLEEPFPDDIVLHPLKQGEPSNPYILYIKRDFDFQRLYSYQEFKNIASDYKNIVTIVWQNFVFTLPLHLQIQALAVYLTEFYDSENTLATYIISCVNSEIQPISKQMKEIVNWCISELLAQRNTDSKKPTTNSKSKNNSRVIIVNNPNNITAKKDLIDIVNKKIRSCGGDLLAMLKKEAEYHASNKSELFQRSYDKRLNGNNVDTVEEEIPDFSEFVKEIPDFSEITHGLEEYVDIINKEMKKNERYIDPFDNTKQDVKAEKYANPFDSMKQDTKSGRYISSFGKNWSDEMDEEELKEQGQFDPNIEEEFAKEAFDFSRN